jgi:SpoVK/Ycf46/Vps4 family AAA+-type ATPase
MNFFQTVATGVKQPLLANSFFGPQSSQDPTFVKVKEFEKNFLSDMAKGQSNSDSVGMQRTGMIDASGAAKENQLDSGKNSKNVSNFSDYSIFQTLFHEKGIRDPYSTNNLKLTYIDTKINNVFGVYDQVQADFFGIPQNVDNHQETTQNNKNKRKTKSKTEGIPSFIRNSKTKDIFLSCSNQNEQKKYFKLTFSYSNPFKDSLNEGLNHFGKTYSFAGRAQKPADSNKMKETLICLPQLLSLKKSSLSDMAKGQSSSDSVGIRRTGMIYASGAAKEDQLDSGKNSKNVSNFSDSSIFHTSLQSVLSEPQLTLTPETPSYTISKVQLDSLFYSYQIPFRSKIEWENHFKNWNNRFTNWLICSTDDSEEQNLGCEFEQLVSELIFARINKNNVENLTFLELDQRWLNRSRTVLDPHTKKHRSDESRDYAISNSFEPTSETPAELRASESKTKKSTWLDFNKSFSYFDYQNFLYYLLSETNQSSFLALFDNKDFEKKQLYKSYGYVMNFNRDVGQPLVLATQAEHTLERLKSCFSSKKQIDISTDANKEKLEQNSSHKTDLKQTTIEYLNTTEGEGTQSYIYKHLPYAEGHMMDYYSSQNQGGVRFGSIPTIYGISKANIIHPLIYTGEPITIFSIGAIFQFSFLFSNFVFLRYFYKLYGKELIQFILTATGWLKEADENSQQKIGLNELEKALLVVKNPQKQLKDIAGIKSLLPEISLVVWFLRHASKRVFWSIDFRLNVNLEKFEQKIKLLFSGRQNVSKNKNGNKFVNNKIEELKQLLLLLRVQLQQTNQIPLPLSLGAYAPKGILLIGPPGTGKTFLVQALAGESEVPALVQSAGFLVSDPQLGLTRLEYLLDQARKLAPCIVFIDEIDTLGATRELVLNNPISENAIMDLVYNPLNSIAEQKNNYLDNIFDDKQQEQQKKSKNLSNSAFGLEELPLNGQSELTTRVSSAIANQSIAESEARKNQLSLLTQFLIEMDGLKAQKQILFIGATNRAAVLDPALTRPGRFDKILKIDLPGKQKRIEILKLYSKNLGTNFTEKKDWTYLANQTVGLSAADLAAIMNQSSIKAILNTFTNFPKEQTNFALNYPLNIQSSFFLSRFPNISNRQFDRKFKYKTDEHSHTWIEAENKQLSKFSLVSKETKNKIFDLKHFKKSCDSGWDKPTEHLLNSVQDINNQKKDKNEYQSSNLNVVQQFEFELRSNQLSPIHTIQTIEHGFNTIINASVGNKRNLIKYRPAPKLANKKITSFKQLAELV